MYPHHKIHPTIRVASVAVDTGVSSVEFPFTRTVNLGPVEALWVTPTAQEEQ